MSATSSGTTSDGETRNRAFNAVDDLTAVPFESAAEDNSNDHESVAPLPTRSLFQSLQHNHNLSSNASLPSIESGTSDRAQSESSKPAKRIPISGGAIPVDPIRNEFPKFSSSLFKKSRNSVSSSSSKSSVKHSESSQQNSFIPLTLPPDGFVSALSEQISNDDTVNDFEQPMMKRPESPTNLLAIAVETNGRQVKEMPESTADSVEVVCPMESIQPFSPTSVSVTQTSETHDDSVIQISSLTVNDQQPTPATNQLPDTPPYSLMLPEVSVPRDIPLDGPSASPDVQSLPLNSITKTFSDSNFMSPKANKVEAKRKSTNLNSYLLNLVTPQVAEVPDKVDPSKTSWRPLRSQHVKESDDSLSPDDDNILARRMEELGRTRRMQLRSMAQSKPLLSESEQSSSSNTELRPQLQTVQEEQSSDVATMLREAYAERQQALRTQLDKALADLQDAQAENKRLTTENMSQKHSISQLKIALDEAKIEKDRSLVQMQNELHDATSLLTTLNKEKKGWQDRLDSMQHKLNASERQVRCLDHLTRHKLESRLDTHFNQPKRRKLVDSAPSPDVIALMRGLNEEIYQTCVQLVDDLEHMTVFSTKHKPRVQKVLGDHLTEMMEGQATRASSGYNVLLMQAVLEVFMTHWCSSIIEAFYPQQESFADLLVQLSTQTTRISRK